MISSRHVDEISSRVIRSGILFKRGKGGLLHRKNWKARYFVLTTTSLRYYEKEDGELKGVLDIRKCDTRCLQTMPSDAPFNGRDGTLWRIAIQTPQRRMIFAAINEQDMNAWANAWYIALSST